MDKVINVVGWVLFGVLNIALGWIAHQLWDAYKSGDVVRKAKAASKPVVETV